MQENESTAREKFNAEVEVWHEKYEANNEWLERMCNIVNMVRVATLLVPVPIYIWMVISHRLSICQAIMCFMVPFVYIGIFRMLIACLKKTHKKNSPEAPDVPDISDQDDITEENEGHGCCHCCDRADCGHHA